MSMCFIKYKNKTCCFLYTKTIIDELVDDIEKSLRRNLHFMKKKLLLNITMKCLQY